ncbi:hypothetical protein IscW_ISCW016421 [Ixodes scapularis]|uniref:Uncharacterized protein n=1 Tax=Ixodes scapularis TaxID=6945 RepID=B7P2Q9_IXOSC|nr:hypothetical protein IscW_ISCW016421 [Ixodes scapularis]|eukprot:XP_002402896.1 hypothetical protein IscW_ISCW016421 [Ixodes scapularis]
MPYGEAPSLADQLALWQSIERVRDLWDGPCHGPQRQEVSALMFRKQRRRRPGTAAEDAASPCWEALLLAAALDASCALGYTLHRALTPALLRHAAYVDAESEDGSSDRDDYDDDDTSLEDSDYETCTENDSAPESEDCRTPPPQPNARLRTFRPPESDGELRESAVCPEA